MKPIVLSRDQWYRLKERLRRDHSPSVMLMRSKMRDVLGFTDRAYTTWSESKCCAITRFYLDFFDESKRTFFLLKYSDYISRTNSSN